MPVNVYWEDEAQHILRWEFEGVIANEEVWGAQDTTFDIAASLPDGHLDVIVHITSDVRIPPNFIGTLTATNRRLEKSGANQDAHTVIVGDNMLARSFMSAYLRINPAVRWEMAPTIEAARELILSQRKPHDM